MKKYEINSENRVVALIDFGNVKTGDDWIKEIRKMLYNSEK